MDNFLALSPVYQALIATLFTWAITALGAATVFITWNVSNRFLNAMLGFAAGVMIAAAYWSLLAPSVELSRAGTLPVWLPPLIGFLLGGAVLWAIDRLLPHLHLGFPSADIEGLPTSWKRSTLLMLAVTLHNIPEGSGGWCCFWCCGIAIASGEYRQCHRPDRWDWHPEFSGRHGDCATLAPGGYVDGEKFFIWATFRHGGTDRGCCRRSCSDCNYTHPALCVCPLRLGLCFTWWLRSLSPNASVKATPIFRLWQPCWDLG